MRVPDEQALRDLLARGGRLDFGCKPTLIPEASGGYSVPVIGEPEVLEGLRNEGLELSIDELPEPQSDVGEGDRFEGGRVTPHGLGEKTRDAGHSSGGRKR